jgi:Ca2+-binding EF-hand superfamily protein
MQQANLSQTGALKYSEWLVASANEDELFTDENLKHVFNFFDKQKSGLISAKDVLTAF